MGGTLSVLEPSEIPEKDRQAVFSGSPPSLAAVAQLIRSGRVRKVLVAAGAGISVSAGIPDFRTPGTGLYDNLSKYGLPTPESVFTLEYFRERPEPFCSLAKELLPGGYRPTTTHFFLRLLEKKGLLLRLFTQNIDGLERLAGISPELLVEAHGSFADAHCIECGHQHRVTRWRDEVTRGSIPRCGVSLAVAPPAVPPDDEALDALRQQLADVADEKKKAWSSTNWSALTDIGMKESRLKSELEQAELARAEYPTKLAAWEAGPKEVTCEGLVKPDIVFFGEGLPPRFSYLAPRDGRCADILLVLGTSLQVMPFAGILGRVPVLCPRLLINRDAVALHDQPDPPMFFGNIGFRLRDPDNYRDVHVATDCDRGVHDLCKELGWTTELDALEADYRAGDASGKTEDLFEKVVASRQLEYGSFESSEAYSLALKLYASAAAAAGVGEAGLSREDFTKVGSVLARGNEEEFLVVFDEAEGGAERTANIKQDELVSLLKVPFQALGPKAFCAVAARQCWCLQGCPRDEIISQFHCLDHDGDGTIDKAELANLLRILDSAEWPPERVDSLLSCMDLNSDGRVQFSEFIHWVYGDRGQDERQCRLLEGGGGAAGCRNGSSPSARREAGAVASGRGSARAGAGAGRPGSRPRAKSGAAAPGSKAKARPARSPDGRK